MTIALKLATLALLALAGWGFTHRLVPWAFVRAGRLMGFAMKFRPLTEKRVRRFRSIRRGYWSFVAITTVFVMSLFLELYVNDKPLYVRWGDHRQSPAVASWVNFLRPWGHVVDEARAKDFGLEGDGELDYRRFADWVDDPSRIEGEAAKVEADMAEDEKRFRDLMAASAAQQGLTYDRVEPLPESKLAEQAKRRAEAAFLRGLRPDFEAGKGSILMPLVPFSPTKQRLDLPGHPPHKPIGAEGTTEHRAWPILGTDHSSVDVLSQLLYGFRVSFFFAIVVAFVGYVIGITVGAVMGYFGGWTDIVVQRGIEIWSAIPFLYTIIIIASVVKPNFWLLVLMLVVLRAWIHITYTIRGEFYREKARDYVQAARAIGLRDRAIMLRHILPNSLVPVVTYLPFEIVGYISTLVSLDYLGFGLPQEVPSWGRLLHQGSEMIEAHPHLITFPVLALAATLFCVVMIGEAVREAFDPRVYARLR
ncbi:MAG: ABC transporter permease subunit [Planctomycetota bacterium]